VRWPADEHGGEVDLTTTARQSATDADRARLAGESVPEPGAELLGAAARIVGVAGRTRHDLRHRATIVPRRTGPAARPARPRQRRGVITTSRDEDANSPSGAQDALTTGAGRCGSASPPSPARPRGGSSWMTRRPSPVVTVRSDIRWWIKPRGCARAARGQHHRSGRATARARGKHPPTGALRGPRHRRASAVAVRAHRTGIAPPPATPDDRIALVTRAW
jgi:hypothetical protein